MGWGDIPAFLGDEVADPDEESFLLFSQPIPSRDLGMIDPKATTLDITVAGRDFCIHQSPTVLASNRASGTTGAAVWRISPLFAEWIASSNNLLFQSGLIGKDSTVLELGCGISAVLAITMAPKVQRYIVTDQDYCLKTLRHNLEVNSTSPKVLPRPKHHAQAKNSRTVTNDTNVEILALDWELSCLQNLPQILGATDARGSLDLIVACDCIYNEALVDPFVRTCTDLSRSSTPGLSKKPTLCVIAQQLRSYHVFEVWLAAFHKKFHVWRVPDELLTSGLTAGSGFAVHVGLLRDWFRRTE